MDIFWEDLSNISSVDFIDWDRFRGKTFFITGATGLIGTTLVKTLLYVNETRSLGGHLIALVRDEAKARKRFEDFEYDGILEFIVGTVEDFDDSSITCPVDYVIHGASQTASKEFIVHAVETIDTALTGTRNLLQFAKRHKVQGFVYLSSMEVYGYPPKGQKVGEKQIGAFSPLDLRNSYPLSKIMCESMCVAYAKEYGMATRICRLTQTFGPGVSDSDNRIFAYFGRCVRNKEDIVLKTDGKTERCYLYTADAATAILKILLDGEDGEVYNAGDENTYCSISEMAQQIAGANGINVKYDIQPAAQNGYPDTLYMDLDMNRLRQLGWYPVGGVSK